MHMMFCSVLIAPAILLAARPAGSGQRAAPTLDHSAPFMGHVLELSLAGGAAGHPARLLGSAAADHIELPVGTLELDRSRLAVVAEVTVAADGTAFFELPLSAQPASAELELHYQALVGDLDSPRGAILSEAVHLRLLNPRAYVGCRGLPLDAEIHRAGVWVVSAIHESVVLRVEADAPPPGGQKEPEGNPNIVFTPNQARGAWMSSPSELVLFDPFFGGVEARVPFEKASPTLLTDSSGTRLAVLETGHPDGPTRVHLLDFETGATLSVIDLPERARGHWVSDGSGTAYVAVLANGDTTRVRRVGLEDGIVHEAFRVGHDRSNRFTDLAFAAGQLFVGTDSSAHTLFNASGALTRLDVDGPTSAAVVSVFPGWPGLHPRLFTAVPDAGVFLFGMGVNIHQALYATRLDGPSGTVKVDPPAIYLVVNDMVARNGGVWALLGHDDGDGQQQIYHMENAPTGEWELAGNVPYWMGTGRDIDSLRDAFVDRIVYTNDDNGIFGVPYSPPLVVLHDPLSHAEVELEIGFRPRALRVVPVP